jgi:hypothetical protein
MIKVIWPYNISLNYWAACLVTDFPNDNLPILRDEKKWQDWGTLVADSGNFKKANIPSPLGIKNGKKQEAFRNWQDWAKIVYIILADDYNTNNRVKPDTST